MPQSLIDALGDFYAQNPRLWIGNALAALAGYDPAAQQRSALEQYKQGLLKGGGLSESGQPVVPPHKVGVPMTPEQEKQAIASGWNRFTPDQERLLGKVKHLEFLTGADPGAGVDYANEAFDPVATKDRRVNRAFKEAQTQQMLADLAGEGEADYDLNWFMDPSRTQEERDRWVRGKHGPSRESAYIQLLNRRDDALRAGDQDEVDRINGLLSRIDKIPGPGGSTQIRDRGTGGLEAVTTLPEMVEGAEQIAAAEAQGKDIGTKEAELPTLETNFQHHLDSLERLLEHPGFEGGVGLGAWNPLRLVPGTTENDFRLALENMKGQLYAMAYETLKGGGHITEFEALQVSRGLAALDASLSEDEFRKNAGNLKDLITNLRGSVRRRAKGEALPAPRRRIYNPETGSFEDR